MTDIEYLRERLSEIESSEEYSKDLQSAYVSVDARTLKGLLGTRDKLIALQAKCDALAAENVALNDYFSNHAKAVGHWNSWADEEDKIPHSPATAATDAEIKAQGVDEFTTKIGDKASRLSPSSNVYKVLKGVVFSGVEFSANLRAGRKG